MFNNASDRVSIVESYYIPNIIYSKELHELKKEIWPVYKSRYPIVVYSPTGLLASYVVTSVTTAKNRFDPRQKSYKKRLIEIDSNI